MKKMENTGQTTFFDTEWLLASFDSSKRKAMNRYKLFVAEGKGQPSSWLELRNQVFLGRKGKGRMNANLTRCK